MTQLPNQREGLGVYKSISIKTYSFYKCSFPIILYTDILMYIKPYKLIFRFVTFNSRSFLSPTFLWCWNSSSSGIKPHFNSVVVWINRCSCRIRSWGKLNFVWCSVIDKSFSPSMTWMVRAIRFLSDATIDQYCYDDKGDKGDYRWEWSKKRSIKFVFLLDPS